MKTHDIQRERTWRRVSNKFENKFDFFLKMKTHDIQRERTWRRVSNRGGRDS